MGIVITNAVYFRGQWAERFDRSKTRKMPFLTPSGEKMVDMMFDSRETPYYEDNAVQAVMLPYTDRNFVMIIVLPTGDVDEYLDAFSWDALERIMGSMRRKNVELYIPRFELDTGTFSLKSYLTRLGMSRAFTPLADFSGIGDYGLYVQDVVHRAYVRVDEESTEAAAATGVVMVAAAPTGYKVFRADHPFLFFIVDRASGAILFAGKIVDPPPVHG